ncbi:DNA binding protein, partial [Tulasnella sp. 427]
MPQAEVMTFNDSVAMVKQSVRCSIGSIVYLRGLFPEENLANVRLKFRCEGEKDIDYVVKQLSKTATGEAKRMNDYIENGICDAIDKQYLSSLVLAIFLDEDDPHNVVEAYTFNFTYHDVSGQKGRVAALDISTRMEDMSLGTGAKRREARRTSISTAPIGRTSFEVATDLRTLLRNISTRVSMLYSLPSTPSFTVMHLEEDLNVIHFSGKRYATFKLYYTPDTPD